MRRSFLPFLTVILLIAAVAGGCRRNRYMINLPEKGVNISVKRLDKELFERSPGSLRDSTDALKERYGRFLQYFSYVIKIGEISDSLWPERLITFATDKQVNEIYSSTSSVFSDFDSFEKGLEEAFSYYLYYFPGRTVPEVFTCITGFNNSIITGDSVLGIGLDRYLGSGSRFYQELGIYKYQTERMRPEYILRDCMYGWAATEFDITGAGYGEENVLSEMIHEGKLLYFTRCMLPGEKEEIIFGFTPGQLRFCLNNEGRMWQYLVENDLLFSTELLVRKKLTGDAPFTGYFSSESPGRAAAWIGYRIVERFMEHSPGMSLEAMFSQTDLQGILDKARYRPPV